MTKRQLLILGALLLLVLLGGGAWLYFQNDTPSTEPAVATAEVIPADEWFTLGNRNARVTLIEYAAPSCPHCAHFDVTTFPILKRKYIDTGKIFYVFRVYLIDPLADSKAEKVARCLPPEHYFDFIDMLYRRQDEWGPEQMGEAGAAVEPKTDMGLLKMARFAGMDADKAQACMTSTALDGQINRINADAETRYNVHSTPTLIANGQTLARIPQNEEDLAAALDPLLQGK
ncbi:MAG: DsbA family protein [Alphaproteobacteria bacterium]|nr:DsbA family protein [Alphaproteobacteria bacterium]